jgi:hypothetical protein
MYKFKFALLALLLLSLYSYAQEHEEHIHDDSMNEGETFNYDELVNEVNQEQDKGGKQEVNDSQQKDDSADDYGDVVYIDRDI